MAIRSNYKGIIQAIKLKSGVNKVYPSNFWGIIEALLDLTGGGGGSVEILPPGTDLPTTGNEEDGDMVGIPNADGNYFLYIYADGAWQPINITTAQVLEADKKPVGATIPKFITPDGAVLETQQDYNNYIVEVIINDQIRQDEDIEKLQIQGGDFAADQDRQDQELEDYKQEVKADQDRQDAEIDEIKIDINKSEDPVDGSVSYRFVTHPEFKADQNRQEQELEDYKQEVQADQDRQDQYLQDEIDTRVERDLLHDAQIETIEYKLDALVGLTFRGTYEFKHEADCDAAYLDCVANTGDPTQCSRDLVACEQNKVRPGYFEAIDPDDQFDHLQAIVIAKSDASSVEIDWGSVLKQGDYLEVDHVFAGGLDKTNYGLYRLTEDPEENTNGLGEPVYTLQLEFLQGDGEMLEREKYEIRGITSAEGVNPEELGDFLTKTDAAATYLPLTGGTLSSTLTGKLIKSIRSGSGYAFEAKPDDITTTAFIRCDGTAEFTSVKVDGTELAKSNHTHSGYSSTGHTHSGYASSSHSHSGYASSSHTHNSTYVKGNYTISYSSGGYYIS